MSFVHAVHLIIKLISIYKVSSTLYRIIRSIRLLPPIIYCWFSINCFSIDHFTVWLNSFPTFCGALGQTENASI